MCASGAAAIALGRCGADASAAVPALLDALNDRGHTHIVPFSVASKAAKTLWSVFVEPPWDYTVAGETIELEVMGTKSSFPPDLGRLQLLTSER